MARASTPPADRNDGIPEAVVGDGAADRPVSHADQAWSGGELGKRPLSAPLLTALVVVTLMAAGSVAVWRLLGAQPRSSKSSVASLKADHTASPAHHVATKPAAQAITHRSHTRGAHNISRRASRGKREPTPRVPASLPASTQVAYRSSQPTYSQPAHQSSQATVYASSPSTESANSGRGAGASAASAGAAQQSSQPAFGANGALGPMSSPDG